MNQLWQYNAPTIYDDLSVYHEENEFYIYNQRDPVNEITRWLSSDKDDVLDLDEMI